MVSFHSGDLFLLPDFKKLCFQLIFNPVQFKFRRLAFGMPLGLDAHHFIESANQGFVGGLTPPLQQLPFSVWRHFCGAVRLSYL